MAEFFEVKKGYFVDAETGEKTEVEGGYFVGFPTKEDTDLTKHGELTGYTNTELSFACWHRATFGEATYHPDEELKLPEDCLVV